MEGLNDHFLDISVAFTQRADLKKGIDPLLVIFTDAQKDSLESLRSYPRLTIENPVLPAVSAPPVASSVSHGQAQAEPEGLSVLVGGTRFGNNAAVVPVGGDLDSDAPTVIENYRVKPKDSMATRHVTVIKKDGRIISIQRNQLNQDDRSGMVPPVR